MNPVGILRQGDIPDREVPKPWMDLKVFERRTWIGHRGLAGEAPENTLCSIEAAALRGFSWIEVDSRPSQDGIAVLSHDADLLRRSGMDCVVSETSAAELTQINVGAGFEGIAGTARLPLLTEALREAFARNLGTVVEIKTEPQKAEASVAAAVRAVCEHLKHHPDARLVISGFSRTAMAEAHRLLPGIPRALTCVDIPDNWQELAEQWQLTGLHCDYRQITKKTAAMLTAAGLEPAAYTVNDSATARRLFEWGVRGIFTDSLLPL